MPAAAAARSAPASDLVATLASFSLTGQPTRVEALDGVPVLINEFWTAAQRQAHRIHEVSYRACFKPQLPAFFIERLTCPGEAVHDPFMGRGTTPIQAALMGRRPMGGDVNPLAEMLVRPRLAAPPLEAVAARLGEIDWRWDGPLEGPLLTFFHATTLAQIQALRAHLLGRPLDPVDDWIRMVALGRLTGHSAGFFSVYTLPPNQAVSVASQARINARRAQSPPPRDVPALILRKSRSLLGAPPPRAAEALLTTAPSHAAPAIPTASAALVVTSPPFLDIVQYAADNWLRCWFAGVDAASVEIAMHRRPGDWQAFVRETFVELARIVRSGGHVAFEVGEVRGGALPLERLVLQALTGLPFEPLCVMINAQAFTKTANCWGVANNAKGTNTNRIVVARRRA